MKRLAVVALAATLPLATAAPATADGDHTPPAQLQGIGREGPHTDIYNQPKRPGVTYMTGVYGPPAAGSIAIPVVERGQKLSNGKSLYTGRWYDRADEKIRVCIRWHESRDAYGANTGTGKYRGAYQLSTAMAVGAGWMVQRELRRMLPKSAAVQIGKKLRATKTNNWAAYWQDMAFWLVWDHGAGRDHWAATNWKTAGCTA